MNSSRIKKRIVVVDDDEDVRETICDVLNMAGHGAVGAADGRVALHLLQHARFDLIVTDLQMPRNGWVAIAIRPPIRHGVETDSCLRRVGGTGRGFVRFPSCSKAVRGRLHH